MSESPIAGSQLGIWRLIEQIGVGGMGHVWRAAAPHGTEVAVKMLIRAESQSDAFEAEAAAMARLVHPRIIRILDFGRTAADDPYLVMELARGPTVAQYARTELIGWNSVARIARCTLEALAHAHSRGIVHRDLKPANILAMNPDGTDWRLTDFGIAFVGDDPGDEGNPPGTPLYMAPEQFMGFSRDLGPWTDLYSLGCVLYELVYGSPPFAGDNAIQLAYAHFNREIEERAARFELPDGFEAYLSVLLRKDPLARFRHAADALRALEKFESPRHSRSTTVLGASSGDQTVVTPAFEATVLLGDLDHFQWTVESTEVTPRIEPALPPERPPQTTPQYFSSAFHGDTGPGLAQLRELPFAGRIEERGELWRAFNAAIRTSDRRTVLVSGEPGIGKTALGQWLCNCVSEHGYARPMVVPTSMPVGEGLLALFRRTYRLRDLEPEPARQRLRRWIEAPEWAERLVVDPSDAAGAESVDIVSAAAAILRAHVQREPVVVFVDDASDRGERERLVRFLAGLTEDVGRLVLVAAVSPSSSLVPDLVQRGDVSVVELGPVPPGDCAGIIQEVIAVDPETAIRLAKRVHGNPRVAIAAVRHWIANDLLFFVRGRWKLRDEALPELPRTGADVLLQYVDRTMARTPDEVPALEIAALFGERCRIDDWSAAVERAGLEVDDDFVRRALRAGILAREGDWFTFVDPFAREALAGRAARQQRVRSAHRAIAPVVDANRPVYDDATLGRHLAGAGRHEDAIEPLTNAIETARSGDRAAARELLQIAEAAMESLNEHETERRWRLRLLDACIARTEHASDAAQRLRLVVDAAANRGWQSLECDAIGALVDELSTHDPTVGMLELAERGVAVADQLGDASRSAQMRNHAGAGFGYMGRLDEALEYYADAGELAREADDGLSEALSDYGLGWVLFLQGHLEAALAPLRRASERYFELGRVERSKSVRAFSGDVYRALGELDEAETLYAEVYTEASRVGKVDAALPINFALTEVARGRLDEATKWARRASELEGPDGRRMLLAIIHGVFLLSAAASRDLDAWDRNLQTIEAFASGQSVVYDLAYVLEEAARESVGTLDEGRARRVLKLAITQWERLGRTAEAASLTELAADI